MNITLDSQARADNRTGAVARSLGGAQSTCGQDTIDYQSDRQMSCIVICRTRIDYSLS